MKYPNNGQTKQWDLKQFENLQKVQYACTKLFLVRSSGLGASKSLLALRNLVQHSNMWFNQNNKNKNDEYDFWFVI